MTREPPREKEPREAGDGAARRSEQDESEEVVHFKGLCMNCDHRFECRLPRPEGGVWHCEEYR